MDMQQQLQLQLLCQYIALLQPQQHIQQQQQLLSLENLSQILASASNLNLGNANNPLASINNRHLSASSLGPNQRDYLQLAQFQQLLQQQQQQQQTHRQQPSRQQQQQPSPLEVRHSGPPESINGNGHLIQRDISPNFQQQQSKTTHLPPTVPSSSLLAKLTAVTNGTAHHLSAHDRNMPCQLKEFDSKVDDLLEAFYAINDNPEPAAIDMIARRINSTSDAIGDWFDQKRLKTNPNAGPRSPPAKKREGGRVVTFSEYQRSLLEAIFEENNYLHPQEYEELSSLIQVPSRNIKIWFKNRRSKQRLSGRISTTTSSHHTTTTSSSTTNTLSSSSSSSSTPVISTSSAANLILNSQQQQQHQPVSLVNSSSSPTSPYDCSSATNNNCANINKTAADDEDPQGNNTCHLQDDLENEGDEEDDDNEHDDIMDQLNARRSVIINHMQLHS